VDSQRTRTWYVTRSLFLGDLPALTGAAKVADPAQAADVVRAGGIAVLPAGSWAMADEVLWLLDVDPGWREHLLHWARTGQVRRPLPTQEHPAEPAPRRPTLASGRGPWPDPPDGDKAGSRSVLAAELAALEQVDGFRYRAVVRLAEGAAGRGMHPDDALRRALDETAADDEVFDDMLAERLHAASTPGPGVHEADEGGGFTEVAADWAGVTPALLPSPRTPGC
jgi:hypothetical protein